MKRTLLFTSPLFAIALTFAIGAPVQGAEEEEGWVSLFDGESLDGWKVNEEAPDAFRVEDGKLVIDGGRGHIFYNGDVANHDFKDFELKLDVMTTEEANSGVYFHTEYQKDDWPAKGYEAQVNTSHGDWRKTGSLYGIDDVREAYSKDGEWFEYHIIVEGKRIILKVDGETTVDYTEPDDLSGEDRPAGRKIDSGTFALQAHDPGCLVYYKNIRVKVDEE